MSALDELKSLAGTVGNPLLEEWKKSGRRVVGFMCLYIPEEIIYAAGMMSYRLRAPGCTDTGASDVYLSHLNCSFARSCLQLALDGTYDFLDGLVLTDSCDHVRRLYDILREAGEKRFLHFISVPHKVSQQSIDFYREDLQTFRETLMRAFDVDISDDSLRDAIDIYNETRDLLRDLYELRRAEHPPLTGAEAMSAVLPATMIPRDRYNALLRRLLEELKGREIGGDYKARLVVAGGGGCDDPAYFETMEELGGLVVADTLCLSGRYFWEPVQRTEDPLLGLASSYLKRPSCGKMADQVADRVDFIRSMVADFNADGVVYHRLRYCDLWAGQLLYVKDQMNKSGIPMLELEREYALGATGQLRTRIQAFLERLEG